ncbi:hypothetical protein N7489_002561, partial [Penicillium chrysogenum]|uniref:uncharacterized protein n=1 Tax=Penicillium chrysogenum TaxID=5076 RepID=UPI0024DF0AAF
LEVGIGQCTFVLSVATLILYNYRLSCTNHLAPVTSLPLRLSSSLSPLTSSVSHLLSFVYLFQLLANRVTERNNAQAAITRAIAAIRSGYEHIIAHYNANQPPDVLVMVTNAIDASIAISEHRWMQYDIEEQRALECFRLILCRHLKGAQLELTSSISIWRPRYIQGRCCRYSEGVTAPSVSSSSGPATWRQRQWERKVRQYSTVNGTLDAKGVVGKPQAKEMASNNIITLPDELDLMQLRQLAVRITERNNTRANIIRARVAIQSAYVQIMAHYEHGQLPDVLVAVTNAIIDSLVTLEHRWTLCNIEEQGDLECFRLFLWRQSGSSGTRE